LEILRTLTELDPEIVEALSPLAGSGQFYGLLKDALLSISAPTESSWLRRHTQYVLSPRAGSAEVGHAAPSPTGSRHPRRSTRERPRCECPHPVPRYFRVASLDILRYLAARFAKHNHVPNHRVDSPVVRLERIRSHPPSLTVDLGNGVDDILRPRPPIPGGHGLPHAGWLRGRRGGGRWPSRGRPDERQAAQGSPSARGKRTDPQGKQNPRGDRRRYRLGLRPAPLTRKRAKDLTPSRERSLRCSASFARTASRSSMLRALLSPRWHSSS